MRYRSCGDWWFDANGDLQIRVADLGNPYYEWFIAEHETNEALLCKKANISEEIVSAYDIAFEKLRDERPELIGDQEPGDMISAPYHDQHSVATRIEVATCTVFGEKWEDYNNAINNL